jgi:hypothetical protein
MNNKLREQLIKEAEHILYGRDGFDHGTLAFAEGVLGFLKALAPAVEPGCFNEFGTDY